MIVRKRCLLWDWTNTRDCPQMLNKVQFDGPIISVSNWNTWNPPELRDRAPFRPMVRLEEQTSGQDWANIENSSEQIIHFFNEPERAGMSTEGAAEIWYKQMLPLRRSKGKKLVSPSCASDPGGEAWLEDFMNRISANPPDYLGLHYYGSSGDDAISYIESMHEKYPHPPIIVSEIACISRKYTEVLDFTAKLANWMDEQSYVLEYGFFGCMRTPPDEFVSPQAQLMHEDGNFTELMVKLMEEQPIKC